LLEAAGETFAELGFRNTTVREICRRAGANIAAINYHFGSKEELYVAVLAYTAQQSLEKYPIGGVLPADAPAAERLEAFVRAQLERLLDEGRPAWFGKLVAREMFEPTEALTRIAQMFGRPQFDRLRQIVSELLGAPVDDPRVRRCCCSVLGQSLFYKQARPMVERLMPEQGFDPSDRAVLAAHITAFSLRAIEAMRAEASCRKGAP
jgi:AcrR family transcriptional regulator